MILYERWFNVTWTFRSPTIRPFIQQLFQADNKESITARHYWSFVEESISDQLSFSCHDVIILDNVIRNSGFYWRKCKGRFRPVSNRDADQKALDLKPYLYSHCWCSPLYICSLIRSRALANHCLQRSTTQAALWFVSGHPTQPFGDLLRGPD